MIDKIDISQAQAERTLDFLNSYYDIQSAPVAAMMAAFSRSCILTNTGNIEALSTASAEAEAIAENLLSAQGTGDLQLDPAIVVAYYKLLASKGAKTSNLQALVKVVAAELERQPQEVKDLGRVRYLTRVLANLGIMDPPVPAKRPHRLHSSDLSRLVVADCDEIHDFIDHLSADAVSVSDDLAQILSYLALAEMRNYKIDWSARVLRFLIEVDRIDNRVVESVHYIALQRTSTGGYGFVDPMTESEEDPIERFRTFQLPITLHAVWLMGTFNDAVKGLRQASAPASKLIA
jgi:hypothetical protein